MKQPRRGRGARGVVGACVAAALTLAGCSVGEGVDVDSLAGHVVTAAIAGEPDQLDPHNTNSYFSFEVLENVYDTLVEPDENLEFQGALAESWDLSDDQLTWTFHLREGVTFHDGSDFTADDVVYSYRRIIDGELANAWRFSAIDEVTAVDDHTVEITVTQPSPNLLANLGGFKGMSIVSKENVESGDITQHPIGTGPFSLEEYTSGDSITLRSNPDYWGGEPEIGGVEFRFIAEGATATTALKAGEIQWTDSILPQQVQILEQDESVVLGQTPGNDYWYLALNEANEPWGDVRARQALAYAIDREGILQATTYGTATANQLAIPAESVWYSAYDEYTLDRDRAQQLFDEAGVSGETIDFLATNEYPETVTTAQIIASNLEPFGFDVNIRTVDFATWLDEQNSGNFDLLMMGWLGNIDPDDFYYAQHHSEGASNAQGYSNPKVDELLSAGRTETDTDTRKEIYDEASAIIADEASYIYLYNPSVVQAWSPDLEGYVARPDGAIRFRDAVLTDD